MNVKGLIALIHKNLDMLHYLRPDVKYLTIGGGGNKKSLIGLEIATR